VFGDALGLQVKTTKKAWHTALLKAHGYKLEWGSWGKLSPQSRAALQRINLHFHDLRHEAGSRLIEAGWPVHHVQEMLGHADLKQTSTYLNATLSGLKDSMRNTDEARSEKSDDADAACKSVANGAATDRRPVGNEATPTDANDTVH
jgi:integrase